MALTTIVVTVCLLGAIGEGAFNHGFGSFAGAGNFGGFNFPHPPLYQFPGLHQPPILPLPVFKFPAFNFPNENDVRNTVPGKGSYNGMFVSSASGTKGGETKILVNNNGEIFEKTIPHNQKSASPETATSVQFPKLPMFDPSDIRSHVPGNSESFQGSMISSQSSYSNINGVEKSDGVIATVVNNNGDVKEEVYKFGQKP